MWLVLISILSILTFVIIQFLWSLYTVSKCFKPIPGWPTHWLYGNLHQKVKSDFYSRRSKWASDNGIKISKEWWGPFLPAVIIHHPEVWKDLLNTPKATRMYDLLVPWLGHGLLIAGGKRWARNRKLLTNAFHFETLKPYIPVYNECTDILINNWTKSAMKGETIVPVYKSISGLTLDVLLRCSFSYHTNCQTEQVPYAIAVSQLTSLVIKRFFSVFLSTLNNFTYLRFTSQGRQFKRAADLVHSYAEKVIAERRKFLTEVQEGNTNTKDSLSSPLRKRESMDFLDILLTARDNNGHGLSDLEIRYEVDTFLFEGHDTTAHGLSWTLYCLAKYPEHQEKCREEVNAVLGTRDFVGYEDLAKLTYTQWCIKEALRLYPPVYGFVRMLEEDTVIDGFKLPKNTLIDVMPIDIHLNSEFWNDPEIFNPLRFHPDNISKQHPFAYVPFSAGPRNCIGQNFAMNEMRVVVAKIVRKFKLSLKEGTTVELFQSVLYGFKDDIPLQIELNYA